MPHCFAEAKSGSEDLLKSAARRGGCGLGRVPDTTEHLHGCITHRARRVLADHGLVRGFEMLRHLRVFLQRLTHRVKPQSHFGGFELHADKRPPCIDLLRALVVVRHESHPTHRLGGGRDIHLGHLFIGRATDRWHGRSVE